MRFPYICFFFFNLRRERQRRQSRCSTINSSKVIEEASRVLKNQCLTSLKFEPSSSWLTLCQIRVHTSCKLFVVHQLLFADCRCLILGASALNISSAVFIELCKIVAMMTSFDLKNSDLLTPNLHIKEVLYGPTYLLTFVFLSRQQGCIICPPPLFSSVRNAHTVSKERAEYCTQLYTESLHMCRTIKSCVGCGLFRNPCFLNSTFIMSQLVAVLPEPVRLFALLYTF